jgi:Phosphoadenosine phosphosulfate reductase family
MIVERDEADIAHVVALSGGKDSTALALRMRELWPDLPVSYVCTPTGDELPEMVEHWKRLGDLLGARMLPVTGGVSLHGLIDRWQALPNNRQRWCTRVLKLVPYYRFLANIQPVVSYVGLRADEESREGMQFPEMGQIRVRFPMREWGWLERDVWAYLDALQVKIPARTDCARCYHQTLGEWWRLWYDHPDLYADAEAQEAAVSGERGRQHTFRNATRDSWPTALIELRAEFERGHVPPGTVRIDDFWQGGRRKTMCRVCSL